MGFAHVQPGRRSTRLSRLGSLGVFALLAGLALFGCAEESFAPVDQPIPTGVRHLLLILVDDLRWDSLGVTGHPFFWSPNIDQIGEEGVVFENAFVITSLCSPSRASVLTGLYTHEHGVTDIFSSLGRSRPTVARSLREAGYRTAWIGKWHLSAGASPFPGFDRWVSFPAQGSYLDPQLNVDGVETPMQGHMTDLLTAEALRFLRELKTGEPFFLVLSHLAVHTPYIAQERFVGTYAGAPVQLAPSAYEDLSDKPEWLTCRQGNGPESHISGVRKYLDLLAGVDESVGLVLDQLATLGILDETLVILASDNGYHQGEHGLGDKRTAYEESMRIPILLRYPPWFQGPVRVDNGLALNLDIGATFLDAANLPPLPGMRGVSLRDIARGGTRREQFLYVYHRDLASGNPAAACQPTTWALRTTDATLIRYRDDASQLSELYDLVGDPFQLVNRFTDPAWSTRRQALELELERLVTELGLGPVPTSVLSQRGPTSPGPRGRP